MQTGRGYRRRYRGLTLLEVSAVVFALVILLVLVPMFFGRRTGTPSRQMMNSTQLRGIHQGLIVFAQSNKGYFPGLDSGGTLANGSVEYRFQILLEQDYFLPDYVISPCERRQKTEWIEPLNSDADVSVTLTTANYSYAMLQMKQPGGRQAEWSETFNTQAIVLSDRDTANNPQKPTSYFGKPTDPWRGSVLWNDNHVAFEQTHILASGYASPVPGDPPFLFPSDNIFDPAGADDAWLIHRGD